MNVVVMTVPVATCLPACTEGALVDAELALEDALLELAELVDALLELAELVDALLELAELDALELAELACDVLDDVEADDADEDC